MAFLILAHVDVVLMVSPLSAAASSVLVLEIPEVLLLRNLIEREEMIENIITYLFLIMFGTGIF